MTSEMEELQMRLMELTRSMDDLNDTVVEQAKQIRFLEQTVSRLEAQLAAIEPSQIGSVTIGDEPPPHY